MRLMSNASLPKKKHAAPPNPQPLLTLTAVKFTYSQSEMRYITGNYKSNSPARGTAKQGVTGAQGGIDHTFQCVLVH